MFYTKNIAIGSNFLKILQRSLFYPHQTKIEENTNKWQKLPNLEYQGIFWKNVYCKVIKVYLIRKKTLSTFQYFSFHKNILYNNILLLNYYRQHISFISKFSVIFFCLIYPRYSTKYNFLQKLKLLAVSDGNGFVLAVKHHIRQKKTWNLRESSWKLLISFAPIWWGILTILMMKLKH